MIQFLLHISKNVCICLISFFRSTRVAPNNRTNTLHLQSRSMATTGNHVFWFSSSSLSSSSRLLRLLCLLLNIQYQLCIICVNFVILANVLDLPFSSVDHSHQPTEQLALRVSLTLTFTTMRTTTIFWRLFCGYMTQLKYVGLYLTNECFLWSGVVVLCVCMYMYVYTYIYTCIHSGRMGNVAAVGIGTVL